MQGKASACLGLIVGVVGVASAEPRFDGRVAVGARFSSTNESHYTFVYDQSPPARLAIDGLIGLRVGPALVGVHAGTATPQSFSAGDVDGGEVEASAETRIYPIDLGLGVEVDTGHGSWVGGWVGATVAFKHATSPATHINSIDYFGDIPAASWSESTAGLGYGVAVGYDFPKTAHGRVGVIMAVESQPLGGMAFRGNDGYADFTSEQFTTRSITLGLTYAPSP